MNRAQYRRQWLKWHRGYERRAFIIFQRLFKRMGRRLIGINIEQNTYRQTIEANVFNNDIVSAYVDVYRVIGIMHGRRVGSGINKDLKQFSFSAFESEYLRSIFDWVVNNAGTRIISVRETFVESIVKEVAKMFSEGLTPSQVATEIEKIVSGRNFYRWQALRIARTEATAAANRGAVVSGDSSGVVLVKQWISAIDARTRRVPPDRYDHWEMNGITVERDEMFDVPGKLGNQLLEFPGDPTGAAGNVINCRCTVAMIPKRVNGRLIFT